MPPASSARPISPPMLAKTIPITRPAVQVDRDRAGLAGVFEVEPCSPPSIIGPSLRGRELDADWRSPRKKQPCCFAWEAAVSPAVFRRTLGRYSSLFDQPAEQQV